MVNILSSASYDYLKQNLLKTGRFNDIEIERITFPDGEHYYRLINPEQLSGNAVVYIAGTINDEAILEIYKIACTLVREGCSSLHIVIPYFGYSTMERAVRPGEIVAAKIVAHLFSSIPLSSMGNYIYMLDLHAPGTQYYFEQDVHPVHLTTEPVIDRIILEIKDQNKEETILASADMGRAKWIERASNRLGMGSAYIMKKRLSGTETVVEALNASVKDKNVIIFDDMVRSGGSIIHAAEAYKSMGAKEIFVVCVHGVFVEGAIDRLKNSGVIKRVYCTNTHCIAQSNENSDFVKVYDISEVIFTGLKMNLPGSLA